MRVRLSLYILFTSFCLNTSLNAQSSAERAVTIRKQMDEREIINIQNGWGQLTGLRNNVTATFERFSGFLSTATVASDLYRSTEALDDNECVPDLITDDSMMMPSGCDDESMCSQCYERPISRINTVRKSLARLSCMKMNTKSFTDAAVAFGDNVAGLHGVTGLAWQSERTGIQEAYKNFGKSYDKKYVELIDSLQTGLKEVNKCESQYGIRDWYQKAGFMYFEMMKEKYKRTD